MLVDQKTVRPRRILVAEDVPVNREILRAVLSAEGHELVFAENGAEAVQLVQQARFDLILMDVQMPVMDGIAATQRIRGLEGQERNIPILALSASATAREKQRYLEAGMNECLLKPFDWEKITAAIDRYGAIADATPLASLEVLDRLRDTAGPDQLRTMVRMGLEAFELYCQAMLQPGAGPVDIGRAAHKLEDSAGTLGLGGISLVAARIESALDNGAPVGELVRELHMMIAATRIELVRIGVLADGAQPVPGPSAGPVR